MRLLLAAVVLSAMPAAATAQSSVAPGALTPLPTIGLPLPPIGLPLPQIGLPAVTDTRPIPPADRRPRLGREQHRTGPPRRGRREQTIVVFPIYSQDHATTVDVAATPSGAPDDSAEIERVASATGRLRIDVQPDLRWQVHVDGYLVGMRDDFEHWLELETGPHRIEIRAAGYEPLLFDVKIAPNRTVTFEGELIRRPTEPTAQSAPAPGEVSAAMRSTFYVIPGCYVGNVPPHDAALPPTCDPRRVITVKQ